jgi:hypothetical protein
MKHFLFQKADVSFFFLRFQLLMTDLNILELREGTEFLQFFATFSEPYY